METEPQQNSSDNKSKVAKKGTFIGFLDKRGTLISIALAFIGILFTIFPLVYERPEKGNKTFRKNQIGGENQMAVKELPPVKSFIEYLSFIVNKKSQEMWDHSTIGRRDELKSTEDMMYDYYLTSDYNVIYIIPILEGNQSSATSPINTHTFSFYALLEFEDKVCLEGEVDLLQNFDKTTKIKQIRDLNIFEPLFDTVLGEVYQFVDRRFVIDSAEYVKNKLREYMMNMTLKEYITQDWRFPILFAKKLRLPSKSYNPGGIYSKRQKHTMLSKVVMVEDSIWKVDAFETVALSRWGSVKNNN